MSNCPFCHPHLDPYQRIIAENDTCYFLMHDREQDVLVGSGVIVPKQHRATTFELTPTEWSDTYTLLHDAKSFLEETYGPDGYTLGWNVGTASNQTVPHAHLHIIPRYADGPHAGKGLRHWLKRPE
ncbi:HIT domain-containing protein [Exiguobacterium sp. SH1S21]|uniref:HIT family protein n=1 Tax=Exiguobacterium sp. SH1S21 TaxID=2510953 RepID=UPI00103EE215|nr:HIT domain-containing protein [Exiguobacterium sp. SH1S21]TCI51982.1 HIT domain-containing protein [Exiguobacterium sp. SH1S21]